MAYGKRLYGQCTVDGTGVQLDVEIQQNNYASSATEVTLGAPAVLVRMMASGDKYSPILGTEATVRFAFNYGDDFSFLYTNDDREYKIVIKKDSVIWWEGFILIDQYVEEWESDGFITVTASDQIGLLSVRPFSFGSPAAPPTTYDTIISILAKILSESGSTKTGLNLPIHVACNLFDVAMNATDADDPFAQASLDQSVWVKDDGTASDCETVLKDILRPFQCRLFQSSGAWRIQRVPDIAGTDIDYRVFDSTGAYVSNSSYDPQVDDLTILSGATLEYTSGWRERDVEVDYGLAPSLIPSFKLSEYNINGYTPADIDGWTNTGAWNISTFDTENIIWAKTVAFGDDHSGYIETPAVAALDSMTYNLTIRCGRDQPGLLKPNMICTVTVGSYYYNDEDDEWTLDFTALTKINFPKINSPNELVSQSVSMVAPPAPGSMVFTAGIPYRQLLGSTDAWYYFNDVLITSAVDTEQDRPAGSVINYFITDDTNYTPDNEQIRISDSLGNATVIPYYKGFIKVGSVASTEWERKAEIGGGGYPLVPYSTAGIACITDSWWWQYATPNKRFNGSFVGTIDFHNTVVIDSTVYLLADIEIDLADNTFSGTMVEVKAETTGSGTGESILKSKTLPGANDNPSQGLIPQPGGDDGELQLKSGGDFDGTTGYTFDGVRILKGALPMAEYRCGTETVSSGSQTIAFAEPFISGDDYGILPMWFYTTDGDWIILTPSALDENGFDIAPDTGGTFTYLAIIKR